MDKFMLLAIDEAKKAVSKRHGGPFGAVVVKDDKVVGVGHNEVLKKHDSTCHAEIMAIRDACKNLKTFNLSGCVLYTTAYPCPMCFGAILWSNLEQIYYGCTTIDAARVGFRDKIFQELSAKQKGAKCVSMSDARDTCLKLYQEYKNSGMAMC